eukprot:scaffold324751_cov83-Cyclotella_meneghiniana.AAC.1
MGNQYRCIKSGFLNNENRTKELPSSLQGRGLFDFATIIMQQLSEAYDESSDIRRDDNAITQSKKGYRRIILPGAGKFKENLAVSQQVRGGGYSAYWRMTDIWTEQNKNKPLPQAKASARMDPSIEQKYWDAIHLAKNLTGVNAVILVTYPSNSKGVNSTSIENWRNIYATNQMIRKISAENNQLSYSPRTLVLDFAKFANQMFWLNARSLGFNVSDPYHVAMSKDGNSEMTSALFFNRWKRSVVVSAS